MLRVLLLGPAAAGTSAVGEAIAASTGWPWLDDDLLLERTTGRTADALLASRGGEALRSAQSDVLTLTLSLPPPLVAGVAAGVVLDVADRQRLRAGGHVVWLRASAAPPTRRLPRSPRASVPSGRPRVALRAVAEERDRLYAQVAHQVLDMDVLAPAQAARQVLAAVRG